MGIQFPFRSGRSVPSGAEDVHAPGPGNKNPGSLHGEAGVVDSRIARSQTTRKALQHAAERLIAERGLESVSIRDIVSTAGQKNESALQYHFKNLKGLISAIQAERSSETQSKRAEMLNAMLSDTSQPNLRQVCTLMVQPPFDLARSSVGFRRYIKAFGHELVLTETSALARATRHGGGGSSGQHLVMLLRSALPHLDEDAYRRRMESAVRLCSVSMYHQARQKNAFRGKQSELFLHSLIDALAGLLSAPESGQTKVIARILAEQ